MWNERKSAALSLICTRIVMVLVAAFALALPYLQDMPGWRGAALFEPRLSRVDLAMLYASSVISMATLALLDRLLVSVRKNEVFTDKNIARLRVISWCCFAVALVFAGGCSFSDHIQAFLLMGLAAAFFGLLLRIVKNVIAAATRIKAENDYTI